MKLMVAYNGTKVSQSALKLARDHAQIFNADVIILNSSEGGSHETAKEILTIQESMSFARQFLEEKNIACETHQLARGLSPGEDIVQFAIDHEVDQIYVGIRKRSRVHKLIMGSTAQYVVLKAKCPVVTVNYE
jgi:nucleotide-binding universal stress UspA family protein